ncbi:MAG: Flp pilus assembly complex ATPase component [Symploca sp. SIO1B1]|nr:Flp pilus assembly complex ATPase component [Symploca sp. SIO2D2]NER24594.1 Flp pilus assembly complex ATPase component [Symploca sp. SIO1C2]NER46707.1 Flp pilus assembly complex ATPase component [Symploca sp. SIO1A3]NER96159.1 Flp pilus assembly complex ATPase component [Symploca sp. SIO1B1]
MTQSSSPRRSRALIVKNDFSPFGNKLVQSGVVDDDQMRQALVETRKTGRPLTEIIEQITGRQLSPELLRQYKKQQLFELKILYGVDSLDPEISDIASTQVGQLIDELIPIDICRRCRLVPVSKTDTEPKSVLVAMADPDNLDAQDDLNRILRPRGIGLRRMVITMEDYQRLIDEYLDEQLKRQKQQEAAASVDVTADFENLDNIDLQEAEDEVEADLGESLKGAEGAPVINLVNKILAKALQEGVSDIHVEPQEEYLRIRFRKDGVLRPAFDKPFPKKISPAVAARFKIMSELDIAERRLPQDGKIRRMYQGRKVDFRVSTLPSRYGEKVVLRILDNESTQLGLDMLITDQETLEVVREMASRPFGLILVTGPTGSGKSTSLYSILAERNDPGVNISTAEDPIEYSLPGITQVQVLREKGMDFASILRSFLRQDPDVILVGETRDPETAKTAIEAALTGHLVLTTLHTNDAAGAIPRLDEMGVEPFMVSGALIGVLAQRLMRRVCSECRIAYQPNANELARFGLAAANEGEITFYKANTLTTDEIAEARMQGTLCGKCNGNGYKGRVGVYEVMQVNERLQTLISEKANADRIKEAAVEEGMTTLLAYSLNLVRQGYTTLEEVERVTFTDSGLEAELKAKRKTSLTCRNCSAELQQDWLDCPYCMTPRFQD